MPRQILLGLILFLAPVVFSEDHPYCLLPSCPNRTHTFCKYPNPVPSSRCGYILSRGLRNSEKIAIMNTYNNRFKPSVSIYEEEDSALPETSRGNRLHFRVSWDDELEELAQRWADQCIVGKDKCRDVDRFPVRQRTHFEKIYAYRRTAYVPSSQVIASRFYNFDLLPRLRDLDFSSETTEQAVDSISSYFSTLMHLVEDRIGCGAIRSFDDSNEYYYFVCNYGISNPENPE